MKRITLLLPTAALLLLMLTGCAGTNSADGYRGNVSTSENGYVNGTNEGIGGWFTGEDGFYRSAEDTDRKTSRAAEDAAQDRMDRSRSRRSDAGKTRDGTVSGDTNTGNPHNAYGDGLDSGRGGRETGRLPRNGRPIPRAGSFPAAS